MVELLFLGEKIGAEGEGNTVLSHVFVPTLYNESFFSPNQLGLSSAEPVFSRTLDHRSPDFASKGECFTTV